MSNEENNLGLSIFEPKQLRRVWYKDEWYYSIIDVIAVLTDSIDPRKYWVALKARARTEGFDETLAQIEPLKLKSLDGRFRLTDTAKLLPAKANLRDHMTPMELALTSLSEATAITYHQNRNSLGFPELKRDAIDAGKTAGKARRVIEEDIGTSVVNQKNYLSVKKIKDKRRKEQKRLTEGTEPSLFDDPGETKS